MAAPETRLMSVLIASAGEPTSAIRENVEAIVRLEESFLRNRTVPERIADAIGSFAGSLKFVVLHLVVYGLWIAINVGLIPGIPEFDKFPFLLLSVAVSIEAIFLATFVLIKQNRESRRADQRAHLDLQINLLAEREMTLVLQRLEQIAERMGLPPSREIRQLSEATSVEQVASELEQKLPEG